jgi:hypothetical protein
LREDNDELRRKVALSTIQIKELTDQHGSSKLFDVLGASDHQSSESPDIDYGADIDSVVKIMIDGKAFTIVENRSASDIKTAGGEESLQNENSNILAMYAEGKLRRDACVLDHKTGVYLSSSISNHQLRSIRWW